MTNLQTLTKRQKVLAAAYTLITRNIHKVDVFKPYSTKDLGAVDVTYDIDQALKKCKKDYLFKNLLYPIHYSFFPGYTILSYNKKVLRFAIVGNQPLDWKGNYHKKFNVKTNDVKLNEKIISLSTKEVPIYATIIDLSLKITVITEKTVNEYIGLLLLHDLYPKE